MQYDLFIFYVLFKNLFTVEELDQHVTFPQRHHIGIHLPKKIQVSVSCLTLYVYFRTPCCGTSLDASNHEGEYNSLFKPVTSLHTNCPEPETFSSNLYKAKL